MSSNDDGGPRRSARRRASIHDLIDDCRDDTPTVPKSSMILILGVHDVHPSRVRRNNQKQPVMTSIYAVILRNNTLETNPDQGHQPLTKMKHLW